MPKITNEELVALAALMGQANLSPSDSEILKAGVARLDSSWNPPLQLACKLLDGKSFGVISDNPRTIDRCKALAEYMGAVICPLHEDEWGTKIAFYPRTGMSDDSIHSFISEGIAGALSLGFNEQAQHQSARFLAKFRAKASAVQGGNSDEEPEG